ncbi:uncharacterized protein METZ01_LOCUS4978 [marine metagenome]|uniref:Uncharacterized protein n=1 Tax=marine metagenome TaxID=408172 RepID=A0A381NDD8_9ZZZZ
MQSPRFYFCRKQFALLPENLYQIALSSATPLLQPLHQRDSQIQPEL